MTRPKLAPGRLRRAARLAVAALLGLLLSGNGAIRAQSQQPPQPAAQLPAPGSIAAVFGAEPSGETYTLTFFNRPIVTLRARVLGRRPVDRAVGAARTLGDLVEEQVTGPVESRAIEGGALISVQSRLVLGLSTFDIDALAGETLEGETAQTVARLQQTLEEAVAARRPGALLRATGLAAAGLAVGVLVLWGLGRARQAVTSKLMAVAERTVARAKIADVHALRASRLLDFQRGTVTALIAVLQLIVVYSLVAFVLGRFPYTRPWGQSLRGFLITTVETLALGMVTAVPGLFTVVIIFVVTRFTIRLLGLWFHAIERGQMTVPWLYPETAQPTRRLVSTLLWLFAIVVAYPYMPGSQTEAFKGVSVFLGLMLTLGSSGIVNQIMSGFMVTYSRAVRLGDFVRIGDVEGTVVHLGVLSTKVRTVWSEEVTIPNAVVVSQTTTDYSRLADRVFTLTSVTIGYDAPWRQVQALLLLAAERTPGLRREPKPRVYQMGLEDFYVRYTLLVGLERQEAKPETLHALHANIQDLFNEYGVQIMSPNYVFDPAAPKVVPKKDWFTAPARPDPPPNPR